ncbi:MAG TPA: hypothetical protein D7H83_05340 [Candidatus Poseidoniales archaeon]|jgi:hypothetical protein|nr:hypothetical protein [Candidatus Poseidoniaceae archaeon]DAC39090.1 MAG TPA: hypothetical protein D7H83_05340 [Candidatus Poseidoniales archaeon]HIH57797.1 hypothetical protein [Candidatus Poseidoniaceae archaeon]|tara:strand:- start:407 stop:1048 length:642 start_codon:yes stop_codon:yes gene_type:complete
MGSVAVGAMVVGTSLLVVFALAMATLEAQVDDSIAQIEASAEPISQFTIENANNVEGAVVSFTINNGGTGYSAGQVEVNGSAGSFLADLVISGGTVTGLNILDHGSSYLYASSYFLEVTGPNTGSNLNISATLGNLVYLNVTNDGSTDLATDFSWLFSDGSSPINLSDGHDGYQPTIIFPGETFQFYYDSGTQATVSRLAITIDGQTKATSVL